MCCGTGVGTRVDGFELGARERSLKVPYLVERGLRPVEATVDCGAIKKLEAVGCPSLSSAFSTGENSTREQWSAKKRGIMSRMRKAGNVMCKTAVT